MPVTQKWTGLRELDQALQRFAGDASEKLLAGGVSAGAAVIQDAIEDAAPVRADDHPKRITPGGKATRGPGFLRRHIRRKRIAKGSGTTITYSIGPALAAFYARFVDQGHRGPRRRRASAHEVELGTRSTPAHPFIRPALSASKDRAITAMIRNLKEQLDRFVRACR